MTATTRLLIRGGWIVTMDPALGVFRGDVLVQDGVITSVEPDGIETDADVSVLDATDKIVMPGMVDTHRHTWQTCVRHRNGDHHGADYFLEMLDTIGPSYTPDDVYIGTLLGALSAIDGGVTTMYDWAHIQNTPAHADAGIRALRDAGLRAVFGHGRSLADPANRAAQRTQRHSADISRIKDEYFTDSSLVTLAMSARGPEATEGEVWRADLDLARELGLMSSIHVGIADLGPRFRAVEQMHKAGELGDDLIFIHGNSCSKEEIEYIAEAGAGVSIGVQVEMNSQGCGTIPTDRFLAAGVWPSLSGDTETVGTGDMLTQARMALSEYRLKAGSGGAAPGAPATLSTYDALNMATLVGARTLHLDDVTGSISPGKAADIVLIDAGAINLAPVSDPVGAIVLAAHPGNVDTVLVGGRVLKSGGELVGIDLERVRAMAKASNFRHPSRHVGAPTTPGLDP